MHLLAQFHKSCCMHLAALRVIYYSSHFFGPVKEEALWVRAEALDLTVSGRVNLRG